MNNYIIAPSILAADFAKLGDDVKTVLEAGADWVHIDVMDNHYVPNLTFGPMICGALRKFGIKATFDVHLMIKPVDNLIPEFISAGANYITFHPEATEHIHRTLQIIHDNGCKAGIALNPATPLHCLDHLWNDVDIILIMSVNPGFGGQKFISEALNKCRQVRNFIDKQNLQIRLEIDGGINPENIAEIAGAGADTFVAGSAIFKSANYRETIAKMRHALKNSNE